MKILYINGYQGSDVIAQRVMLRNSAMGGNRKIELISRLLQEHGHEVTIFSCGIPAERSWRWFNSFESQSGGGRKNQESRVIYASGLDIRLLNYLIAVLSSLTILKHEVITTKFDMMLIYNIDEFTISVALYYWYRIKKIPMVLEYEDGVIVSGRGPSILRQNIRKRMETWLRNRLSGAICVNANLSLRLRNPNTYILPGVVDNDLSKMAKLRKQPLSGAPPYIVVFSGSLTEGKGVQLIPEIAREFVGRLHFIITGNGPLYTYLSGTLKKSDGNVELLGYVERDRLNQLLTSADFLINPHLEERSGGISPFKLIEYLAAGSIVLTTNLGSLHNDLSNYCEIIKPDIQNVVEVIENIILNPEKALNRSKLGQEWVISNYSSEKVGKSIHQIINRSMRPK